MFDHVIVEYHFSEYGHSFTSTCMDGYERACDRDIAYMDVGTKFLSGT